jgi:cytidylate kinase
MSDERPATGDVAGGGDDEARGESLVTLDGPAGVGKSTTARAVASELGYRYLDSGALYRAVTHALQVSGVPPGEWPALSAEELGELELDVRPGPRTVEIRLGGRVLGEELRSEEVTRDVSLLAQVPAVRRWLHSAQRAAAREGRLVADGRDMGTVVFPEARTKVFLTADVGERARRRLGDRGVAEPDEKQLQDEALRLGERDARDQGRAVAPLRVPSGALILDTTHLTFEEQVRRIVEAARGSR